MNARKHRAPARKETQLAYEALSIEGGLLSPEWLSKVGQLQAGTQAEADYRIPKGLNLRDEIGRYWRIAQAHWAELTAAEGQAVPTPPERRAAATERFVLALLREALGFTTLEPTPPVVLQERRYPIGHAALDGRVPIVIAPGQQGLDALSPAFGDGSRRRSAFGLAQEYLNAQGDALWGIASDGASLRIIRDNASLTRPAWIEADLARLFTEERYHDFAALWLLCHETRFGREGQPVTDCALEAWRNAGREEGTRAREHLRRGVEEALGVLGQGFFSHPENSALRADLQSGALATQDYFGQLLRLVYRLIFLLTVEERGLLHPGDASARATALYESGYSLRRLRERSVKRSAHDRFSDLWEAVKIVTQGLASGEPRLGLPALAGIFAKSQCPALDGARLENRALLVAVFKLAWLREGGSLSRVNWRDMGPEELGSVYESLLELVPQISQDGRQFVFATGGEAKGNARKTSGSYYTPDSLVQVLLDSALEPIITGTVAQHPKDGAEALLSLAIVDPACGSGHFLLAAARRLAAHVARLESSGTPSAAEYRHALRRVVGRCIFGVDLNPMAVELCKVSLWMEAVEPGLPLTFLDSHIQHGNALLGATPELIAQGIPDKAWDPIEGDDRKAASALKKRNKKESTDTTRLLPFGQAPESTFLRLSAGAHAVDDAPDATLEAIEHKAKSWSELTASNAFSHQKFVADTWCAAFVWPKQPGELSEAAPTNARFRELQNSRNKVPPLLIKKVAELTEQYHFFHWHLQFPQVFAKGGFDVVLGNPPWEALRLQEKEFFASRAPEIAEAETSARRKALIAQLNTTDAKLRREYSTALRSVEATNAFIVSSERFPLSGVGRVNLYALFAEAARSLVGKRGRVGQILPSGIVSDDSTKLFFQDVVEKRQLVSFFDFENREGIFGSVHRSFKFGILTLASERLANIEAEFAFFATRVDHVKDSNRRFTLSVSDLALVNPVTRTCPSFRSRRAARLTADIYRRLPTLPDSGWEATPRFPLDVGRASADFARDPTGDVVSLYEGKYFHQFEHRWATRNGTSDRAMTNAERGDASHYIRPRYAFPRQRLIERYAGLWPHTWVIAWRDIARSTDERTFIATVVPSLAVAHTAWLLIAREQHIQRLGLLLANFNSFVFDYVTRQKAGGTHIAAFIVEQLPVIPPTRYEAEAAWDLSTRLHDWVLSRVLELTYTAWDLEPFARDVGYIGTPFRWDSERRFQLRCELDAAFFHLYGLSRDDVEYVMETFPIVRKNDEKAHGEYRTKHVILENFDLMMEAARHDKLYETRLSPPPADPRVAHSARESAIIPLPIKPAVPSQLAIVSAAPQRNLPAWSPDLLPAIAAKTGLATSAGRWGTTLTGIDLGIVALAAVLRNIGGPASRDEVERAVVLSVLPGLLQSKFDVQTAPKWRRAIGTANMNLTSVAALSIPWAEVLRRATVEHLLEIAPDGRWLAGVDIDDAPPDVFDARTLVALSWLESAAGTATEDAELTAQLGVFNVA